MFKLLVVEDDRELNRAVCSFLNRNGYDALGCLSALVFGVGMCCFLVWSLWALGALLCVVGIIGMLVAPWLYRRLVEKRKAEIAPEILRLTEELSQK